LTESETPADVMLAHATALTRGVDNMCALIDDGSAECWQDVLLFAPDAPIPALRPAAIPAVQGAKEIAQGSDHLCMLLGDGSVQCMGSNEHSQLGTGKNYNDQEQSAVMVPVLGLSGVQHISAGDDFTCALLGAGTVSCWGDIPGQAGPPNFDGYPTPVVVPGLHSVIQISATSADHVCALLKDGSIACWGGNEQRESGGPTADDVIMAVTIAGVSNALSVSIGDDVGCAVDKDGRVLCWGEDFLGGPDHSDARSVPF
jgi:alpha-tubulin suppressor-like RCC1 family protein